MKVIVKDVVCWAAFAAGLHVRLRVLPADKVTGKRPVIEYTTRWAEAGTPVTEQRNGTDHVVSDEHHAVHHATGEPLFVADGEEHVVEYTYESQHAEAMRDHVAELHRSVEHHLDTGVSLEEFAINATETITRKLCLAKHGWHRCHLLHGHGGDDHHHHGGKSWPKSVPPQSAPPPVKE